MKGRRVTFKKFIPKEYMKGANVSSILINGTGVWEDGYQHEGIFLEWGLSTNKSDQVVSVALVEVEGGGIEEVLPRHIKFTDSIF
jgi:hypothetical protein